MWVVLFLLYCLLTGKVKLVHNSSFTPKSGATNRIVYGAFTGDRFGDLHTPHTHYTPHTHTPAHTHTHTQHPYITCRLGPAGSAICVYNATKGHPRENNNGIHDIFKRDYFDVNNKERRTISNLNPFDVREPLTCTLTHLTCWHITPLAYSLCGIE